MESHFYFRKVLLPTTLLFIIIVSIFSCNSSAHSGLKLNIRQGSKSLSDYDKAVLERKKAIKIYEEFTKETQKAEIERWVKTILPNFP